MAMQAMQATEVQQADAAPLMALDGIRFAWRRGATPVLALDRFHIDAGERIFVSGASGSGKSTLLALLAGIHQPQAGTVRWRGASLAGYSGARRDRFRADHIGIVFQQLNLVPYLNVLDNVLLACTFSAARTRRAREQGASVAEAAGMLLGRLDLPAPLWKQPAGRLSIGQQQRVAAARALLGRPELVLADEPTSALDAARQAGFMDLLQRECHAAGASLVFVSHDARLAEGFDRRVSIDSPTAEATP
ncbi:ABC transporter ATP-binding protein [Cupriavidus agavae]|uniref:Putative ABC transport system ATP-binding protein n=1 Tax=Cupriavidus agavae TaxID=1001822 RepID=A0A4Q7S1V7_9BURK|nr:ABC transporter ATP-binding protein [Cupriavidus agavae]RZT39408.1 putative ABC transport system ATP-binding protein [Cupriavidus agavae]